MHHGVTFNFGSAKVCSPAIIKKTLSCDTRYMDCCSFYHTHFYIIVLFPSTAILQLINFTAS